MKKVYSFDIFDTCFVRACGDPLCVFDLLAQAIIPEATETQWIDFALERRRGEQNARTKFIVGDTEDITLSQIYECCDFSLWTKITNQEILEKELEIEKNVLVPVSSIKHKVESLRNRGMSIIFISDMYLPCDFIRTILSQNGFLTEKDFVYVSCDSKKTKLTGNLFKLVAQERGIKYKEWIHFGDNKISDVFMPKTLGIETKHISHVYSLYEKQFTQRDFSSRMMESKMLASICKAVRLSSCYSSYNLVASNFVAPMFVTFVYAMLLKARKQGIRKLFFFARDSYIFYVIAQEFRSLFSEIELVYIYVSRKSLYLPGLKNIDYDSISKMFWNFNSIGARDIIERLQLDSFDVSIYENRNLPSSQILKELIDNPSFVSSVDKKREEQKSYVIKYFKQVGLGGENCGIVDFAGTRRCHTALNRILEMNGLCPAFGFYYEVMGIREIGLNYWSFHFDERYSRNEYNCCLYPQELFEQYFCMTDQNRTSSYTIENNRVIPVFETEQMDLSYKKMVAECNVSICGKFAKIYAAILSNADSDYLCKIASSVFSYFHKYPKIDYIRAFSDLQISDSSMSSVPFFRQIGFLKSLRSRSSYWRQAEIMLNCPFPNLLLKLKLIRHLFS